MSACLQLWSKAYGHHTRSARVALHDNGSNESLFTLHCGAGVCLRGISAPPDIIRDINCLAHRRTYIDLSIWHVDQFVYHRNSTENLEKHSRSLYIVVFMFLCVSADYYHRHYKVLLHTAQGHKYLNFLQFFRLKEKLTHSLMHSGHM